MQETGIITQVNGRTILADMQVMLGPAKGISTAFDKVLGALITSVERGPALRAAPRPRARPLEGVRREPAPPHRDIPAEIDGRRDAAPLAQAKDSEAVSLRSQPAPAPKPRPASEPEKAQGDETAHVHPQAEDVTRTGASERSDESAASEVVSDETAVEHEEPAQEERGAEPQTPNSLIPGAALLVDPGEVTVTGPVPVEPPDGGATGQGIPVMTEAAADVGSALTSNAPKTATGVAAAEAGPSAPHSTEVEQPTPPQHYVSSPHVESVVTESAGSPEPQAATPETFTPAPTPEPQAATPEAFTSGGSQAQAEASAVQPNRPQVEQHNPPTAQVQPVPANAPDAREPQGPAPEILQFVGARATADTGAAQPGRPQVDEFVSVAANDAGAVERETADVVPDVAKRPIGLIDSALQPRHIGTENPTSTPDTSQASSEPDVRTGFNAVACEAPKAFVHTAAFEGGAEHAPRVAPQFEDAVLQPGQVSADARMADGESGSETMFFNGRNSARSEEGLRGQVRSDAAAQTDSAGKSDFARRLSGAQSVPRADQVETIERIVKSVTMAVRRGQSEVRIILQPPKLGSVRVEMLMKNGVLNVSFETQTQAARHVISSNLPHLKAALESQGIEVEGFNVSVEREAGQPAFTDERRSFEHASSGGIYASESEDEDDYDPFEEKRRMAAGTSLVDYFV